MLNYNCYHYSKLKLIFYVISKSKFNSNISSKLLDFLQAWFWTLFVVENGAWLLLSYHRSNIRKFWSENWKTNMVWWSQENHVWHLNEPTPALRSFLTAQHGAKSPSSIWFLLTSLVYSGFFRTVLSPRRK